MEKQQHRPDPWSAHLAQHGLTEVDAYAQPIGWRVRTANAVQFTIEYQGGLTQYIVPGMALRTYTYSQFDEMYQFLGERERERHLRAQTLFKVAEYREPLMVDPDIDEEISEEDEEEDAPDSGYPVIRQDYDPYRYE